MADSEDQLQLKKRARRRLVGAIALVTFVVIVLPMLFDKEPKPLSRDISIQIPNPDGSALQNKLVPIVPPAPATAPAPINAPAVTTQAAPAARVVRELNAKADSTVSAKAETKPAEINPSLADRGVKPIANGVENSAPSPDKAAAQTSLKRDTVAKADVAAGTWVVKLGAFADNENVKRLQAQLSAAGIKSYTEALDSNQGQRTRVRAGPFATRVAAERAQEKLKKMGHVGVVGEK